MGNDDPDLGHWVSLHSLNCLCNPFETPPWEGAHLLTLDMVREAIETRALHTEVYSDKLQPPAWQLRHHVERIAYLAVHGWKDPIHVDVGVPFMGCCPAWPVLDGNHRVAAAMVRGDQEIWAEISGSCDRILELFGNLRLVRKDGFSRGKHLPS